MKNVGRILCMASCLLFGANCNNADSDTDQEETIDTHESKYELFGVTAADRTFLTELDNYFALHHSGANYPMCIYSEAATGGVAIASPDAVRAHMTTVVNTWLPNLVNRWSWKVPSVSFQVMTTKETSCAASYGGFRPFRVTSWVGGAFGGMPRAITVRFPGNSINAFADGTSNRQAILHEVGHVLNLAHTMGQVNKSVMDYDDMYTFKGIGGDDILGLTHSWKQLSGQSLRSECEFGYTSSSAACVVSGGDLAGQRIKNLSTGQCIQSGGTGSNVKFTPAACSTSNSQRFDVMRNANGTWRMVNGSSGMCMKVASDASDAALQQTYCNQASSDQNFILLKNENGTYKLMSEQSRMLLQIKNGGLAQSSPGGQNYQSWDIKAQ